MRPSGSTLPVTLSAHSCTFLHIFCTFLHTPVHFCTFLHIFCTFLHIFSTLPHIFCTLMHISAHFCTFSAHFYTLSAHLCKFSANVYVNFETRWLHTAHFGTLWSLNTCTFVHGTVSNMLAHRCALYFSVDCVFACG